jgi:FkbM family methyltransferase
MSYYALCGSVALSNIHNVTCYQVGLGSPEQVGEQTLKIVSEDGGGSTLHATSGILREEVIQIKTLDSFQIKNIGFIKMDVEENELYVLQGAVETLRNSNYPTIIYECNPNSVLEQKIYDFLTQTLCYRVRPLGQQPTNMYIAEK